MAFIKRKIDVTFKKGSGSFAGTSADLVKVTGLRVAASIQKNGLDSMCQAQLRVYGLPLTLMNQLATLGRVLAVGERNSVQVEAGDDESGMSVVFQGTIQDAYADLNSAPDSLFVVNAFTGLQEALKPAEPISVRGSADVSTLMSGLAVKMGMLFEDGGVQVRLADPYYAGTFRDQVVAIAAAANINQLIDAGTLAIWPAGGQRKGLIPKISAATGMVGYPAYTNTGIMVTTLFNPSVNYGMDVEVESEILPACGKWNVYGVSLELESETPGGAWFTQFQGSLFGHDVPVR